MSPSSKIAAPNTICVFLPNWIGDVVMATPTLRALRERFPAPTRIVGVMRPYVAKVLSGTSWLDDQLFYDRHGNKPELSPKSLLRQLRPLRPDMAVMLSSSWTTAWLAWRSGAKQRVGFARNLRRLLLTHPCYDERDEAGRRRPISTLDQYLQLAAAAGCGAGEKRVELATLASDEVAADEVWRNLRLTGRRVVMMNVSAATGDSRIWPREHVESFARQLVQEAPDVTILLLCGPAERDQVAALEESIGHPRVVSMAGQDLGLSVSRAVIRRAHVLVTTDSGPRHIGAAFQTPTVVLFGPTTPLWTLNYNPNERWVSLDLECRPCEKKKCPLQHLRCMRDLGPDTALDAVRRLLNEPRGCQAA